MDRCLRATDMVISDMLITPEDVFNTMPVAMALLDRSGTLLAVNNRMAAFSGRDKRDLIGKNLRLFSEAGAAHLVGDFEAFDKNEEVPDHDLNIKGTPYSIAVSAVRDRTGRAVGILVALTDITRLKSTEHNLKVANRKLLILAAKDPLTGINNARSYYKICEQLINKAHSENTKYSAFFVDIDYFKKINDTYGHHVGDNILQLVSATIKRNIRKGDVFGRVGGEEFAIFLPNTDMCSAHYIAEKIRIVIENLMPEVSGNKIKITVSIGVICRMDHHKSISDIQRDADHAMYHAKMNGRNRVCTLSAPCYIENRSLNEEPESIE